MEQNENTGALLREIKELARKESVELVSRAEADAGALLAAAGQEAERSGLAAVEAACGGARSKRRMLHAAAELEAGRLRAARLETLLALIKADAEAGLGREAARADAGVIAALAAEAVRGMEGTVFEVTVPAGVLKGRPGLASEIEGLAGKGKLEMTFKEDPGLGGGAAVLGAGGRQFWDNSFAARLERLWPELRSRFAAELAAGGKP